MSKKKRKPQRMTPGRKRAIADNATRYDKRLTELGERRISLRLRGDYPMKVERLGITDVNKYVRDCIDRDYEALGED